MRILVTGATGFIGTNLTRELRKNNDLFILGQFEGDPEKLGLPGIVMTDDIQRLADYIKSNKIEGIIHLASLYLTVHTPEQVKELVSSNVYFGTAVLEAASLAGTVKWFLNTGSIWQNYNVKGDAYNPVNLYAATKQAFIDMAKYYSDVFGIKFCTLKLCDTYGPNDTRKKLFKLFKDYSESGEVLKMSPGEQKIDLTLMYDHDKLVRVTDELLPLQSMHEGAKEGRTSRSLTILVDMDDTIEQLVEAWIRCTNERYGYHSTVEDVKSWNMTEAFPGLTKRQVYDIPDEPGFWGKVKPMPGAVEGVRKLIEDGHQVYIVTATQYESLAEKMSDLLFKYFPYIEWDHVIITKRKQMIRGDVLIDDGPHNLEGGEYEKILVDAPHNRSYDAEANGMICVHNWDEILKAVDEIAKRKPAAQ